MCIAWVALEGLRSPGGATGLLHGTELSQKAGVFKEVFPMKRFALVLCTLGALASAAMAADNQAATPATLPAAVLTKPYTVMLGDMLASAMTQLVPVVKASESFQWRIDGQVVITYDHTSSKLVVSVFADPPIGGYGAPGVVDKAKASLEYFRGKVFPVIATSVGQTYGVSLNDTDLTLVYFNRGTMKEVIRREGAKYLVSE
jgi:hypothetical protein